MIRQLPRDVVDRIAAGEVIERPASVVKELVENALDAGARRVVVEIEKGGKQLIRVADDGCGMSAQDLELAFSPHATSKLSDVDDLLAIASYGFRGEALASIGAVARARVVAREEGSDDAFEVTCEGGALSKPRPCGAPRGTVVEARHLFFNVPARSRFQKSDSAEASRCLDQVIRFALARDGVAFSMQVDGRSVFEVAANTPRRERMASAYGRELADGLIEVSQRSGDMHVEAMFGRPEVARSRAMYQHLYMNGRLVKDGTMRMAVRQAYREFLAPSLQPVYVLLLTVDPAEVDVNVHPAKVEIRFRNASQVFRAIYHVTLDALRAADLAPRPGAAAPPTVQSSASSIGTAPGSSRPSEVVKEGPSPLPPDLQSGAAPAYTSRQEAMLFDEGRADSSGTLIPAVPERTGRGWLRLFQTYILYESGSELVVVDQHALHERVLFERLREQVAEGGVRSQRLLVPEIVEVGRAEMMRLDDLTDEFSSLGLEVTAFGETSVAVHALPALLKRARPEDLVGTVLSANDPLGRAINAPLEERLHSMACRGAVKAADHLEDDEIEALLDQARVLPETKACPHGRPTSIRLSRTDLERWFKRSGF